MERQVRIYGGSSYLFSWIAYYGNPEFQNSIPPALFLFSMFTIISGFGGSLITFRGGRDTSE